MKDLVFSLIYNFNTRLILFIISIFSVKLMTVTEYGDFSYILTLITTLAIFSLFGGGVAVNRSFSVERGNGEFVDSNKIFQFNIVVSLIVSSVLLMVILIFNNNLIQLILFFLIFLLMSVNGIVEGAMYGLGAYKELAINSTLVFLISVFSSYFLIQEYKAVGALVSLLIYRMILFLFNFYTLFKMKIILYIPFVDLFKDPVALDSFKKVSLPTFLSAILVAPVIMVLIYFLKLLPNGTHEIAYFSWVNQIYTIAIFFPSVLTGFLISKMTSNFNDSYTKLKQYSKYNLLFGILLSSILFAVKPLVLSFAGSEYGENSNVTYNIMLITICFYCLNAAFGSYWTSINKAHLGLLTNFIWALLVVCFGFFFINTFLSSSAIFISLFLGYIVIFLMQIIILGLMRARYA